MGCVKNGIMGIIRILANRIADSYFWNVTDHWGLKNKCAIVISAYLLYKYLKVVLAGCLK